MIHISQEELFRKIELEHDQNKNNNNNNSKSGVANNNTLATIGANCDAASLLDERCGSPSPLPPSNQAAHATTTTRVAQRRCSDEEMSPILPAASCAGKAAVTRDKNNNNCSTANPTGADEDEVQAVLITGCGSKIGSNIAVAFAARGLKVALVDFDSNQTEGVAQECQDNSPKNRVPLQIVADISQLAEAHKVIDRTIEAFGRLDVLVNTVNNASLMEAKFNASGDDDPHVFEQYHKIIANNMHAITYLCISAAPYLRKTKGSIVNVSSITNNETGSYKFAYCMSKAGISTLTKCLATDLAPDIKVICVSPKSDL